MHILKTGMSAGRWSRQNILPPLFCYCCWWESTTGLTELSMTILNDFPYHFDCCRKFSAADSPGRICCCWKDPIIAIAGIMINILLTEMYTRRFARQSVKISKDLSLWKSPWYDNWRKFSITNWPDRISCWWKGSFWKSLLSINWRWELWEWAPSAAEMRLFWSHHFQSKVECKTLRHHTIFEMVHFLSRKLSIPENNIF